MLTGRAFRLHSSGKKIISGGRAGYEPATDFRSRRPARCGPGWAFLTSALPPFVNRGGSFRTRNFSSKVKPNVHHASRLINSSVNTECTSAQKSCKVIYLPIFRRLAEPPSARPFEPGGLPLFVPCELSRAARRSSNCRGKSRYPCIARRITTAINFRCAKNVQKLRGAPAYSREVSAVAHESSG